MKRTTQKQRTENAKAFNTMICEWKEAAIVVERADTSNSNIVKTRFKACVVYGTPIVIAESIEGISGCFREYFKSIGYQGKQTDYFDDNFNDWIYKEFDYTIEYKDGMVFMIRCK